MGWRKYTVGDAFFVKKKSPLGNSHIKTCVKRVEHWRLRNSEHDLILVGHTKMMNQKVTVVKLAVELGHQHCKWHKFFVENDMIIKIDMVRSMHLYAFWKVEQSSGPFENLFKLYGRHSG